MMDMRKCYEAFGGDFDDALSRLMSDERIERFVRKFIELDDCGKLLAALEAEDYEAAFLKAHDLKGTSSNMGFTELYRSSFELCEALRGGKPEKDITAMTEQVKSDCGRIKAAVSQC